MKDTAKPTPLAATPPARKLTSIHRNNLGTVSFDAHFKGMRKPQEFVVYPLHTGADPSILLVQSGSRVGRIYLKDGRVVMCPPVSGGAYFHHLALAKEIDHLSAEDLFSLKAQVFATAHGNAGSNGVVFTDNSAALEVFD